MECDKTKMKWNEMRNKRTPCVRIRRSSEWANRRAHAHSALASWQDEDIYLRRWKETTTKTKPRKKKKTYPIQIIQRNYSIPSSLWYNSHFCSSLLSLSLSFGFISAVRFVIFKKQPFLCIRCWFLFFNEYKEERKWRQARKFPYRIYIYILLIEATKWLWILQMEIETATIL